MWSLPISMLVATTLLAIPLSRYLAWVMDGRYRPRGPLRVIERALDSGPQTWRQYTAALLIFNTVLFVFGIANFFLSASIGFCALTAIIRAVRGGSTVGNFFVDMWRVVAYMFLPIAFVLSLVWVQQGSPMTYKSAHQVSTLESGAMGSADDGTHTPVSFVVSIVSGPNWLLRRSAGRGVCLGWFFAGFAA